MKTQIGEVIMNTTKELKSIHLNKTSKYLLPCLKEYGEDFTSKLNNVYKIAVGIGDIIISNRGIKHEKHVFILADSSIAIEFFLNFLEWVKEKPMYEDDYVFGNIVTSNYHMIIVKLPEKCYNTFETFKLGKYSEMYKKEDVDRLFKDKYQFKRVILKNHNYKIKFVRELNEFFNLRGEHEIIPSEYDGELDFPPDKDEIFNNHIKKR